MRGSWWRMKSRQDMQRHNPEELRSQLESTREVLEGLQPLRPRAMGETRRQGPMQLLDGGSNIGRSVEISGANADSILTDVLNLEAADGRSREVTIHTLESLNDHRSAALAAIFPIGQLSWGSGGVRQTIDFDWLHGQTFSVAASSVRLAVRSNIPLPAPNALRLGAFAGYGVPGSGGPRVSLQLTDFGVIGAGATTFFTVPAYAKEYIVRRVDTVTLANANAMRVVQRQAATVAPANVDVFAADEKMTEYVPLISSADQVGIVNTGANPGNFQLIWGLSI